MLILDSVFFLLLLVSVMSKRKLASKTRRTKKFWCQTCDKYFTRNFGLTLHMRIHRNVNPYRCDECPQRFPQKYNLFLHKRSHTKEQPFECEFCLMRFSLKQNLNRHLKEQHGNGKTKKGTAPKRISLSTHKGKRTTQSLRDSSATPAKSPEIQPKKSNEPQNELQQIIEVLVECQMDFEPNQPVDTNKDSESNENSCQMDVELDPLAETNEVSGNIIENSFQVDGEPNRPVETNEVNQVADKEDESVDHGE